MFIGERPTFDERDQMLLEKKIAAREKICGPRLGDFVKFPNGIIERFSHDWGDSIQTSPIKYCSFYLGNGEASFSGSLNPGIPKSSLKLTEEVVEGEFWFFHHDSPGAGRGVYCTVPCRMFETTAEYRGFLS